MTAVAQPRQLFDGSSGSAAPYKAEFVSSLVAANLEIEINQILRKGLEENKQDFVKTLVDALKVERETQRFPIEKFDNQDQPSDFKIGIIGGGVAGLYTALVLKFLKIDYEVLEAHDERWGGRLFTYHFPKDPNDSATIKHQYYDIGAMRFPNSPIMARTFNLFKRLEMGEPGQPRDPKKNVLIPYYLTGNNCPTRYNDITAHLGQNEKVRDVNDKTGEEKQDKPDPAPDSGKDPFKVSTINGGTVPFTRVSHEANAEIFNDAYGRFRQKIKSAQELTEKAKFANDKVKASKLEAAADARQHAYEYLMRHDKYSLRDYLINVEGYDPETVHWLETTDSASGWFDMAFTENVFESLAFDYSDSSNTGEPEKSINWYCIDGGTSITVDRILERLDEDKLHLGMQVNKMVLLDAAIAGGNVGSRRVAVTMMNSTTKKEETRNYSAIVNTTTLGALQKMDLTGMEIPYGMKTAIRVLRYDTSTKVGIQFKEMWWKGGDFDINLGGVAKTDLPIRVCVYPSYNIKDSGKGVLLASYTWGQDSERIASHVSNESPTNDKGLKELMIYNLARLHTIDRPGETPDKYAERFEKNKKTIADNWITHHAYDWSKDQFSSGAFALFSPGQFSTLIPHLVRPASNGRLVIVGEHASANHAWIVGALDSAVRGLKQILTRFNMRDKIDAMVKEFEDVDELKQELVAKQVIISMLTEDQMRQLRLGRPVQAPADVPQT